MTKQVGLLCRVGLFKGRIDVIIPFEVPPCSVVEINWRPAGVLHTWVGLTLDNCKKVDKTIMTDQKGSTSN
jgi:hypothetical protein